MDLSRQLTRNFYLDVAIEVVRQIETENLKRTSVELRAIAFQSDKLTLAAVVKQGIFRFLKDRYEIYRVFTESLRNIIKSVSKLGSEYKQKFQLISDHIKMKFIYSTICRFR